MATYASAEVTGIFCLISSGKSRIAKNFDKMFLSRNIPLALTFKRWMVYRIPNPMESGVKAVLRSDITCSIIMRQWVITLIERRLDI